MGSVNSFKKVHKFLLLKFLQYSSVADIQLEGFYSREWYRRCLLLFLTKPSELHYRNDVKLILVLKELKNRKHNRNPNNKKQRVHKYITRFDMISNEMKGKMCYNQV